MARFDVRKRHIRWNVEESPDLYGGLRYHFVIVDDGRREEKMMKILESFRASGIFYPFEEVRSVEGKCAGTRFKYLFRSYDTLYSPDFLRIPSKNSLRDFSLVEKKRGTIEDYVSNIYE